MSKILVVDDEERLVSVIQDYLALGGFHRSDRCHGREALEVARR